MLFMKVVAASFLLVFVDRVLAFTIYFAALVTFSWLVYIYLRDEVQPGLVLGAFHCCLGLVFLIGAAVLFVFSAEYVLFKVVGKLVIGAVLIVLGLRGVVVERRSRG